jgi:ribonuclease-3
MRFRLAICAVLLASGMAPAQTGGAQPGTPPQSTPAPAQTTPQPAAAQASSANKSPQAKTKEEFDAYKAAAALTNPDQVLGAADQFAQKYPESELRELLYVQAMNGFAQQNNPEKEIEAARKAIAIDPHDPNPLIHAASALVEVTHDNDLDKEQRYSEASKDAQAAIDNINTGMHIPPNVPAEKVQAVKNSIQALAYETLGVIAMQKQDFATAETNFQKSVDVAKAEPMARVYLRLSVAQDNEKKYAEALVNADKALQYSQEGSVEQTLAKQQQTRLQKLVGEGGGVKHPFTRSHAPDPDVSRSNESCNRSAGKHSAGYRTAGTAAATALRASELIMNSQSDDVSQLEEALGHRFIRRELLEQALTHSSFARELESQTAGDPDSPNATPNGDNEQFEFLGDAVLSFVISQELFRRFPHYGEGELSKLRAHIVSERELIRPAEHLAIGKHLRFGRGEEKSGGRNKITLLVDALEAVIAALYLDAGIEPAHHFIVNSILEPELKHLEEIGGGRLPIMDYKSALQESTHAHGR